MVSAVLLLAPRFWRGLAGLAVKQIAIVGANERSRLEIAREHTVELRQTVECRLLRESETPGGKAVDVHRTPGHGQEPGERASREVGHVLTTGFHLGSYSRDHSFIASASPRMWPFFGSVVSLRPVWCEMVVYG